MLFLEILLSIHGLLWVSSWLIGRPWFANQPSFKLKFARILLVSCVIAPLIVHCFNSPQTPERLNYLSIDSLQNYVSQPILKTAPRFYTDESVRAFSLSDIKYYQVFYSLFGLLILVRCYRFALNLGRLRSLLAETIPYRSSGKLMIKVSSHCHIPFSLFFMNKAYIVLPVSLLSSPKNVAIAIAHEGQHHRNGDCLWAYFIEGLRIFFFANPGVKRWHRILSELQEFSCDEVLAGHPTISAHDYGRCLVDVVQTASQCSLSSKQEFACTVGMALSKNEDCTFILRRISMLSTYPSNVSKSLMLGFALAGFSILAPIAIAYSTAGTLASPKAKEIDIALLDPRMQGIAENEIIAAVKRYHAKSGVIAIADPGTGNLVAFAEFANTKEKSWKSRQFSPGSTIKPFIAATAIDSGHSSATQVYDCPSPYQLEGKTFTDFSPNKGSLSLTEAMAKSSNVCLIKVSQETGAPVIRKKLAEFGFDMNSWWQADQAENLQLAMAALGENIPVTVESLTKSYAMLAHKGEGFDPKNTAVISAKTNASVTQMLEYAVTNGTGRFAAVPGLAVAGKTGTVAENSNFAKGKQLSLFAGYWPAKAPRYVTVVVIEDGALSKNGETLASGGELAAPVFRRVAVSLDTHS